jgi:hypothetical protein
MTSYGGTYTIDGNEITHHVVIGGPTPIKRALLKAVVRQSRGRG